MEWGRAGVLAVPFSWAVPASGQESLLPALPLGRLWLWALGRSMSVESSQSESGWIGRLFEAHGP
jgi:hypothetical protein